MSKRAWVKALGIVLMVVMTAVVLPSAMNTAQASDADSCHGGVLVEGRCLSVDGSETLCVDAACVEFVDEVIDSCPDNTVVLAPGPPASPRCERTEPASQAAPRCPDGARGTVGSCFIYVAVGPAGCPSPSAPDSTGNCSRPVGNAQGAFFCDDDQAQLSGRDCVSIVNSAPSSCPAGTARFDGACWRLNGLSAPESCAGHEIAGTVDAASGLCQVPLVIPSGPTSCTDGAQYREHPSFILINQQGQPQGDGPIEVACVDNTTSVGIGVRSCVFLDDDFDWFDDGDDGLCTRYTPPITLSCPAGYSFDDSLGGACARFETANGGQCAEGGMLNGQSCVFQTEFAEFECPAETDRHPEWPTCVAYRGWQGQVTCSHSPALLLPTDVAEFGLSVGCFPYRGPQPNQCNGEGTVDSCFETVEPAAIDCGLSIGCITVTGLGEMCGGLAVTIDMTSAAGDGMGTSGNDVILGTPNDDVINGLGGDDKICGLDGRDRIRGGPGVDTIFGGFGIDYIHGEAGNDVLDGDGGSDRMWGGADDDLMLGDSGADRMFGGAGNDEMRGMGGQDFMWGEGGDDLMQGNFQTDNMWGGPGNDDMFGAGGKDSLFGESGDDDLFGGNNTDYLDGGDGTDTANGGRGRDKPLVAPGARASNGQLFGGSGCIAETIANCQPTP